MSEASDRLTSSSAATSSLPEDGDATERPPILEIRGVSKRFGSTQALDGRVADASAGEIHALLGENGAGKSTLDQDHDRRPAAGHRRDPASTAQPSASTSLPGRPAAWASRRSTRSR